MYTHYKTMYQYNKTHQNAYKLQAMYQHTVNQQNVCNSQKMMVSKIVYASVLNIPVSEQLTLFFST